MKSKIYTLLLLVIFTGCSKKRAEVIENPVFDVWNSTILEIDKIEMNDSATVIHFDAFSQPGWWISINEATYIRESDTDQHLVMTRAEGITIGEQFFMPDSGKTSFKLFFPPLPPNVKKIDFIESDCDNCFKIWGINLIQDSKVAFDPIPSVTKKIDQTLPKPEFSSQPAVVSGKLLGYKKEMGSKSIEFYEINQIFKTGEDGKLPVADDGSFNGSVFTGFPIIASSNSFGNVFLVPGEEINVYVDLKKKSRFESRYRTDKEPSDSNYVYIENSMLSIDDYKAFDNITKDLFNYEKAFKDIPGMNPDQYRNYITEIYNKKLAEVTHSGVSKNAQTIISVAIKGVFANLFLQYEELSKEAYYQVNNISWKERGKANYKPEKPGIEYYTVLGNILNDSMVYHPLYGDVVFSLLNNDHFININDKNKSVEEQFNLFRKRISPVVGREKGLFFDIGLAQLYATRLDKAQLFAEAEKQSIKNSFENSAYVEYLISENDKLNAIVEANKTAINSGVIINETPNVAQEKVLDAIIEKYKGKVVVVDFWATWCGPCVAAMESIKPVKEKYKDLDVVFVYLTGETSPYGAWNKAIPNIHGEHYRVSQSQWKYWYNQPGIEGVPTYIIFDKAGKQISKHTGFPGVDTINESIEKGLL